MRAHLSSCSARFASILFAAAGLAVASPAIAFQESRQPDKSPRIDRNQRENKGEKLAQCDFRPHSWLSGLDVYNDKNEHIADVSDFIINRGSGRIDYVVLKTGQTMGMGGKDITMPYGSLRWDAGEERFTLSATEDQLKTYPEFTPESWAGLSDEKKTASSKLRDWLSRDQPDWSSDPYAGSVKSGQTKTIEGEITKLEREDTQSGEQVVATVKDSSGTTHRVWLGPSWFVNGSSAAPMRGDKVTVHAYGLDRDGDSNYVGRKVTINGKDLDLRNDDGHARWGRIDRDGERRDRGTDNRNDRDNRDNRDNRDMDRVVMGESPNVTWRSVLASELKGRAVICRGQECGKVNDIIVDRNSGQVAMLSIDPNENFLGIGDTKHLVPWQVTTVAVDGTLRIDASKDMVLASPAAPSDVTTLNNGATAGMVYKAYDIDVPSFRPVTMSGWKSGDASTDRRMTLDNPWRKDGPIVRDVHRASTVKVEGEVTEITQVTFNNGTPAAKAVRVKTADGEKLVLLCPASHVVKTHEHCKSGKKVEIDAAEVTIDGQKYLMARTVESDGKEWKLFNSNSPIWDS